MRCETCHGSGSIGPLPVPCGDCGGSGVAHCCDGIQEQRDPGDETPEDNRTALETAQFVEEFVRANMPLFNPPESTDWPDRLGEMERGITGCADDCCHPSHNHLGAPGPLNAYASFLTWVPKDINWNANWRDTLEKARKFNALPDTHDEWRSLNESEDA